MLLPSFAFLAVGGLGPMLAAILMTAYRSGMSGVRRLFGQLKRWRVSPFWYAVALLGIPAIGLAAAAVHVTLGGTLATGNVSAMLASLPFQFVFVALIGGGVDEEMGWRGYALPRLQALYDPVGANLILGVLWTCWHLPLFFVGSDVFARSPFALYLLETTAISFVLGWLYNSTGGSLLLAVLGHTAQPYDERRREPCFRSVLGSTLFTPIRTYRIRYMGADSHHCGPYDQENAQRRPNPRRIASRLLSTTSCFTILT